MPYMSARVVGLRRMSDDVAQVDAFAASPLEHHWRVRLPRAGPSFAEDARGLTAPASWRGTPRAAWPGPGAGRHRCPARAGTQSDRCTRRSIVCRSIFDAVDVLGAVLGLRIALGRVEPELTATRHLGGFQPDADEDSWSTRRRRTTGAPEPSAVIVPTSRIRFVVIRRGGRVRHRACATMRYRDLPSRTSALHRHRGS